MTERQFVETIQTPRRSLWPGREVGRRIFFGPVGGLERSGSLTNAAMACGIRWLDEVDEFPAGR